MQPLLQVKRLHAGYARTEVLHGLDFALAQGAITALIGANGAGKTTTLRALCNMVRSAGEISLAGRRIEAMATEDIVRLGVAHVPQGRGTFVDFTTEENLRLAAHARSDRAAVERDYERVYAYFPRLKERRGQRAGSLSGGEQQMLALARALMLRPRLLLLDEPSFGLAPRVVREWMAILDAIRLNENVGILLVEQNAALALELADHVLVLETGRIVLAGAAEALRQDKGVRRAYLGS